MAWLRGWPEGRVWALVLWDHAKVPFVGQYEPKKECWISETNTVYPSIECSYSTLPFHEKFDKKTHLMDVVDESYGILD